MLRGGDDIRQIIKFLLIFMLSTSLIIPTSTAWSLQTHQNIANNIYHSLPSNVQQKLNLNEMKKGSIAPDVTFKDNKFHKYPASYKKAQKWLNKGKTAYKNKKYKYASYSFGVASHYISDTYSAPHSVTGETKNQHKAYENRANKMTPSIKYKGKNLNSQLKIGYKQGKSSWKKWTKTKKSNIIQKDLNNAGSTSYSMIRNCV